MRMVRERTRTGRPRGPPEFVERLAKLLGRPLAPKKRGRKPKRKKRKADESAPSPKTQDNPGFSVVMHGRSSSVFASHGVRRSTKHCQRLAAAVN